MRVSIILTAILALSHFCPSATADEQSTGLGKLRGSWEVSKSSDPKFEPKRLVFDGKTLTIDLGGMMKEATIKIDPSAKPAQIDILFGKQKSLGIYDVSGDTLRLCFSPTGEKRPTEFKATEGILLVTLKREKK